MGEASGDGNATTSELEATAKKKITTRAIEKSATRQLVSKGRKGTSDLAATPEPEVDSPEPAACCPAKRGSVLQRGGTRQQQSELKTRKTHTFGSRALRVFALLLIAGVIYLGLTLERHDVRSLAEPDTPAADPVTGQGFIDGVTVDKFIRLDGKLYFIDSLSLVEATECAT